MEVLKTQADFRYDRIKLVICSQTQFDQVVAESGDTGKLFGLKTDEGLLKVGDCSTTRVVKEKNQRQMWWNWMLISSVICFRKNTMSQLKT